MDPDTAIGGAVGTIPIHSSVPARGYRFRSDERSDEPGHRAVLEAASLSGNHAAGVHRRSNRRFPDAEDGYTRNGES